MFLLSVNVLCDSVYVLSKPPKNPKIKYCLIKKGRILFNGNIASNRACCPVIFAYNWFRVELLDSFVSVYVAHARELHLKFTPAFFNNASNSVGWRSFVCITRVILWGATTKDKQKKGAPLPLPIKAEREWGKGENTCFQN